MTAENWPQGVKWEDPIDFMRQGDNLAFVHKFGISKLCNFLWYPQEAWWPMHSVDVDSLPGGTPFSCELFPGPPLGSRISLSNLSEVKTHCPKGIILWLLFTCCTSLFWLVSYLRCTVFSLSHCGGEDTVSWILQQSFPVPRYTPCWLEVVSIIPTAPAVCFCCVSMMSHYNFSDNRWKVGFSFSRKFFCSLSLLCLLDFVSLGKTSLISWRKELEQGSLWIRMPLKYFGGYKKFYKFYKKFLQVRGSKGDSTCFLAIHYLTEIFFLLSKTGESEKGLPLQ